MEVNKDGQPTHLLCLNEKTDAVVSIAIALATDTEYMSRNNLIIQDPEYNSYKTGALEYKDELTLDPKQGTAKVPVKTEEAELRAKGKELGIRGYHTMKLDNLKAKIAEKQTVNA